MLLVQLDSNAHVEGCLRAIASAGLTAVKFWPEIGLAICLGDMPSSIGDSIIKVEEDGYVDAPTLHSAICPPYFHQKLNLREAHKFSTGRGARIWLLDTGIWPRAEFGQRIEHLLSATSSAATDDHGHGTHVAGIAAAAETGDTGLLGVAPGATLNSVKVLSANNTGCWSNVIAGLMLATRHGAQVINISLGATVAPDALRLAVDHAAKSALIVAAAGNLAVPHPFYPAKYENVFAVGALDSENRRYPLSNQDKVDVYAYGRQVLSTTLNDSYECRTGTSMAAPQVAGLAALLIEQGYAIEDLRDLIVGRADGDRINVLRTLDIKRTLVPLAVV